MPPTARAHRFVSSGSTARARSLLGPLKGEGAVTVRAELYPFRLAAGRYAEDGELKLHVNVDPVDRPLSIEADGMLALAGGEPRFDGTSSLSRPVGIASRGGDRLTQPWRASGKIKATAASALMPQFEFQYGSDERGAIRNLNQRRQQQQGDELLAEGEAFSGRYSVPAPATRCNSTPK